MSFIDWSTFFSGALLMGCSLVAPGYVVARDISWSRATALCVSPSISVALYALSGIVLSICGVRAHAIALLFSAFVFAILFRLLLPCKKKRTSASSVRDKNELEPTRNLPMHVVGLYALAGIAVTFACYVMRLDGPESFATASDTCAHLNYVRAFVESGSFSVLKVGSFASSIEAGGFYPAAWHVLVAIAATFTKSSIPMAANVVDALILALVFPSACALLLSKVFADKPIELRMGSVVCICFVGFPWTFLVWGQLVSNMLGFALVPVFVFLFDELLSVYSPFRTQRAVCLLLASIALIFSQPNAIFSAGIFCVPIIIERVKIVCNRRSYVGVNGWVLLAIVLIGITSVWLVLYKAPFMKSVVSFDWKPTDSFAQSVVNGLSLAYGSLQTAQPFLAVLVLLGFVRLAADERSRRLCAVYLFCFLIYIANNTIDFPHSHVLSGFWYNDPYRTGAMLAMASIPLACSGMSFLLTMASSFVGSDKQIDRGFVYAVVISISALALLIPTYELPGYGTRRTGFGSLSELISSLYSHNNAGGIDDEEWDFLDKVHEVVGNNLVLNIPEDGSGVLYGVSGMNVLFRRFPVAAEDPAVAVLGRGLSKLSTDSEVRCKVRAMGLRYVMMLDCNAPRGEGTIVTYASQPDLWSGVYSIESETPGFELILSEGDMRLYRISDDYLN